MEKITSGIGGNIPVDPSTNSDPAIGSSALSVANGIQQSSPSGISSAVDVFERASEGDALSQTHGSLAPDASILPPANFFSNAQNLSDFHVQVANTLQDPNFDPNQGLQDLDTKLQNEKGESQAFQALASMISEVIKNFGGALQNSARD